MPPARLPRSVSVRDLVLFQARRRPSAVRRLVIASAALSLAALIRAIATFGAVQWSSTVLGAVLVATFGAVAVAGATALRDGNGLTLADQDESWRPQGGRVPLR